MKIVINPSQNCSLQKALKHIAVQLFKVFPIIRQNLVIEGGDV